MGDLPIDQEPAALARVRAHMKERMAPDFKAGKLDATGYDALQVKLDESIAALNAINEAQKKAKLERDKMVKQSRKARADYGREVANICGVNSPEFESIQD